MVVNRTLVMQVPGIQQKVPERSKEQTCVEPPSREGRDAAWLRYIRARLAAMKALSVVHAGKAQDHAIVVHRLSICLLLSYVPHTTTTPVLTHPQLLKQQLLEGKALSC